MATSNAKRIYLGLLAAAGCFVGMAAVTAKLDFRQTVARRDGITFVAVFGSGLLFGGGLLATVARLFKLREIDGELLRQQADEIQNLYDNAPCGYHSLDGDGIVTSMNQTELRWLGYSKEEVIGHKMYSDLLTDEGRAVYSQRFSLSKKEGREGPLPDKASLL